ncbi:hypothetical protein DFH05DRAFT_430556 [Lentinula detonsa]|uniref:Uncharacterized protein n=1 Tax=Lentinula detonsa TaxID=2804962 RepID=A0A9W8NTP9_9AGAR|nr:hypothetical protein DFH05DRAFT_430556 [Lentinula detonsa]
MHCASFIAYVLLSYFAVANSYPTATQTHANLDLHTFSTTQTLMINEDTPPHPLQIGEDEELKTVVVRFHKPTLAAGSSFGAEGDEASAYVRGNALLLLDASADSLGLQKPYNVAFDMDPPCSKEKARKSGFGMSISIGRLTVESRVRGGRFSERQGTLNGMKPGKLESSKNRVLLGEEIYKILE